MQLTCELDLSDFHTAAEQTEQEILKQTVRGVNSAVEAGRDEAKAVGPFQDQSGRLRRDIYSTSATGRGDGAKAEIVSPTAYSEIIEGGSRAHPIYPRAGRGFKGPLRQGQTRGRRGSATPRLVFTVGGRLVFAEMVNHPGTPPLPFMGPAYLKAEAVLTKYLESIPATVAKFWK